MKKICDFPAYQQARELLTRLELQLRDATREAESLSQSTAAADPGERDTAAVLAGKPLSAATENSAAEMAWRKVRALERGIEQQRTVVAKARTAASEEICKTERPGYEKILRAQAQAVEALVKAHKAEAEFRDQLMAGDVEFSSAIRPCGFDCLRELSDDAERWFVELRENNYKI
jgi:ABC-type transporter Mla subunit MlaD